MVEEKLRRILEIKFLIIGWVVILSMILNVEISKDIEVMGSLVEKGSILISMIMSIEKVMAFFLMMLKCLEILLVACFREVFGEFFGGEMVLIGFKVFIFFSCWSLCFL